LEEASGLLRIPPWMGFIIWKNDDMMTKGMQHVKMIKELSIKELLKEV